MLGSNSVGGFPITLTKIGIAADPAHAARRTRSAIFLVLAIDLRCRPPRHPGRPVDLRDRPAAGGRVLLRHPGDADQVLAVRAVRRGLLRSPASCGRSGLPRRATTPAPAWSSASSRSCCSAACRSSAAGARSSASCSPPPCIGVLPRRADARQRVARRCRTSSPAGCCSLSVVVPNSAEALRRLRRRFAGDASPRGCRCASAASHHHP